ncbi:MAG: hypothetical protein K8L99_29430 [Anaerolineae bacterium]|nr:hypothetical protein [Anaerolineae bacterium]
MSNTHYGDRDGQFTDDDHAWKYRERRSAAQPAAQGGGCGGISIGVILLVVMYLAYYFSQMGGG